MTIKLAWDASPNADRYNLYYGPKGGALVSKVELGNVLTHSIEMPVGEWDFAVTAISENGESAPSNVLQVVIDPLPPPPPPPPPPTLALTGPTTRELKLTRRKGYTSRVLYLTVNPTDTVTYNGVLIP